MWQLNGKLVSLEKNKFYTKWSVAPNSYYMAFKSEETNEYTNSSERFDETNQLHKKTSTAP